MEGRRMEGRRMEGRRMEVALLGKLERYGGRRLGRRITVFLANRILSTVYHNHQQQGDGVRLIKFIISNKSLLSNIMIAMHYLHQISNCRKRGDDVWGMTNRIYNNDYGNQPKVKVLIDGIISNIYLIIKNQEMPNWIQSDIARETRAKELTIAMINEFIK